MFRYVWQRGCRCACKIALYLKNHHSHHHHPHPSLSLPFLSPSLAQAINISLQAVLALYANGRSTGVVLDIGDGVAHVVPVADGFGIPHAIERCVCLWRPRFFFFGGGGCCWL